MAHSPWDDIPENTDATPDGGSVADGVETPLSPQQESEVWKSRAHQLWETARQDGNTQAQASAITVALRHLTAAEKSAADKVTAEAGVPEELKRQIEVACLDKLVAAHDEYDKKFRSRCPVCRGSGDRKRIRAFERWMQTEGQKDKFDDWTQKTPNMSGTLEDTKGHFYDEFNDDADTNNKPN